GGVCWWGGWKGGRGGWVTGPPAATLLAAPKVPLPIPSSMLTPPPLATARSENVSPLKSATATQVGLVPAEYVFRVGNVPLPAPSSTTTPVPVVTARSRLLSALKNPVARDVG